MIDDEIVKQIRDLYDLGYNTFLIPANEICQKIVSLSEVENLLDHMISFCADERILKLFKQICRKYYMIYPEAIVFQINLYKELYVDEEED